MQLNTQVQNTVLLTFTCVCCSIPMDQRVCTAQVEPVRGKLFLTHTPIGTQHCHAVFTALTMVKDGHPHTELVCVLG